MYCICANYTTHWGLTLLMAALLVAPRFRRYTGTQVHENSALQKNLFTKVWVLTMVI